MYRSAITIIITYYLLPNITIETNDIATITADQISGLQCLEDTLIILILN